MQTKPETIYPKSYAPSSSVGGPGGFMGLSMPAAGESKLSFDAFSAPIHAKYSTAGVLQVSSPVSSVSAYSDSSSRGAPTRSNLYNNHHRSHYPSVVEEGEEDRVGSPMTMSSDIRMGFVRGEQYD
ncbi:hypothetical protein FRB90_005763 [Tulasnella sp. 427]|nr:hypothetical protein FRB90_005763 [Tulasnella sp. 427]